MEEMMKLKLILALLVSFLFSINLFAGDSSSGCGLGWEIAPKNSLLSSSIRTTTHVFLPNTFSMTFGTSNCAQHSIVQNDKRGIHYAEANFDQLMTEMAQGNGEYLAAFAHVLGCNSNDVFGQQMQQNYSNIYTSSDVTPIEMYQNVKKEIRENSSLSSKCQLM